MAIKIIENENGTVTEKTSNRVDRGTLCPSTSHCTVRTGLVYGAT